MSERSSFRKQFSIKGVRFRSHVIKTSDGLWKIFSVGAVDMPTALLPFDIQRVAMDLVRTPPFNTENQAKAALLDADA